MVNYVDYNIIHYLDSISGVMNNMFLSGILAPYKKCKKYSLSSEVSEYLYYVEEEQFYIPPVFNEVKTDVKMSRKDPKFVIFSAPGATGKSALAKHISNSFDAIYWNLSKVKVGTNSFAGSILNAVGPAKYSEFIGDLNCGNVLLVIDAFDEAEIVSGRKMLSSFITDISNSLSEHTAASVFLLARTETAQYIASFCADNGISAYHYEIGFFEETAAKEFIIKSVVGKEPAKKPDIECVNSYYDVIKNNITDDERSSFLGYAPVLEAISMHIKASPNRQKMISELSTQKDCVSIIMNIMEDLLKREQTEKVVPAFIEKCKSSHPEFSDWDKVYSEEEQLVRIIYYVLLRDKSYNSYPLDFLPPQLVDEYQSMLDTFLPQHPFIRNISNSADACRDIDFTGPAFRDYSLAKIILNEHHEELADMYFEESQSQSYFPSQIFFDCYLKISDETIHPSHISYVYDSYKAKATAYERPYLQCSERSGEDAKDLSCIAVFGMMAGKQQTPKREETCVEVSVNGKPLAFAQLAYVSIDTPSVPVVLGRSGVDSRIFNSSIICKELKWATRNVTIESYGPEGCLLVAREGFAGESVSIDIVKADELKVCTPNINEYYKFIPYKYDFEDTSTFDITKFIHALRCILVEFRTHKKDTLAKTAERIEYVVVGNSATKRQALEYMKHCGIIYPADHLYKVNEAKMQEKGIHFNALARMDIHQMNDAFMDFCKWANS